MSSLSPAEASSGGPSFTLTVNGANFVLGATVRWNGNDRPTTFVSAAQVQAEIPASDIAQMGSATVVVVNPSSATSNSVSLTIGEPVARVASLSPAAATAGGINFVLTVKGTGFISTSVVRWNGSERPTTFVNATTLQAPIPASDIATAGTVSVTVFNPPPGTGASAAAGSFVVNNPAPTVTAVSPSFVPPGAAAFELTVNGTGFVAGSIVTWNGTDRPTTFVSNTQLRASISAADAAAQGTGQVTVVNGGPGGGTSMTQTVFVGNPMPTISELDPAVVRTGGAAFTLRVLGAFFVSGSVVRLNGVNATTTFVSATELQVAVAAADIASNGVVQVAAINPTPGGGASSFLNLTVGPLGDSLRIAVANDGTPANAASDAPSISFDGRYVAFMSKATNLVANDANGRDDIFVRDTCRGATSCVLSTSRVSVATGGGEASGHSSSPSVSGDGRYVAFVSEATNLVPGDGNGVADVFVRDTCAGAAGPCTPTTVLVSVASDGSQGLLASSHPSISRDGRFIAFLSASILVLPDVNDLADAFVHDTCVGVATGCSPSTIRVSSLPQTPSTQEVVGVSIGHDGRFVAFMSVIREAIISRTFQTRVVDTCAGTGGSCSLSTVLVESEAARSSEAGLLDRSLSDDARIVTYWKNRFGYRSQIFFSDSCIAAPSGCVISAVEVPFPNINATFYSGPRLSATGRFIVYAYGNTFVHDNCFGAPPGCFFADVMVTGGGSSPAIDGLGRAVAVAAGNDIYLVLTGR